MTVVVSGQVKCGGVKGRDGDEEASIGVNRPAIVREIPHFGFFPAFPHFCENVPHFWLNFENRTNFRCTETFSSKNLCENVNDSVT